MLQYFLSKDIWTFQGKGAGLGARHAMLLHSTLEPSLSFP